MWFLRIHNQQLGPIEERDVAIGLANGAYQAGTLVWRQGFTGWMPISQTELNSYVPRSQVGETTTSRKRLLLALGSVFGCLASALGITAVFFPDALNLGKKQFATLSVQIDGVAEMELLEDFIQENRGNIVQLDLSICVHNKSQCPSIETQGSTLTFRYGDKHGEHCDGDQNTRMQGLTFNFGEGKFWGWEKLGICKANNFTGVDRMSGHFLIPSESGFGMGWTEWSLSPISNNEIELKNY
jgi:hypothetical protein